MKSQTFDAPEAVVLSADQCVAATFVPDPEGDYEFDGETFRCVYFAVPVDATPDQMQEIAFAVRHGRPMEQYQRWVIEEAKRCSI